MAAAAEHAAGVRLCDRADARCQALDRGSDPRITPAVHRLEGRHEVIERAAASLDDLCKKGRHRASVAQGRDRVDDRAGQMRARQALHRKSADLVPGSVDADVSAASGIAARRNEDVPPGAPWRAEPSLGLRTASDPAAAWSSAPSPAYSSAARKRWRGLGAPVGRRITRGRTRCHGPPLPHRWAMVERDHPRSVS